MRFRMFEYDRGYGSVYSVCDGLMLCVQCGPIIPDGSPVSASDVSSVRRPGCTPKFSQLIHDKRAVRSVCAPETKHNTRTTD